MRLTQLFVNRPPLVFVVLALIAIVGVFSLATLVQQQFPNIDFPTVNVSVSYPGASPSELRDAVVRPLEDAIAGAPDLDHITTSIQQNQASISATFTLDSNQTTDLTSVQDRIQTAQSALPVDLPAPSVRTFDPAQAVVVTLSLTSSSLSVAGLSAIVTNNIVPALEQVDGISSVTANGTVTPALEVTVDPQKLASYGYTPNDVVSAIQANNVRAPGGIVYSGNRETTVDIRGDVTTPQSIADLLLTGSTAVLTGATSPSGTLTQKYNSVTGSTNQALALGSATASSTTSSATGSIGTIGSVANHAHRSEQHERCRLRVQFVKRDGRHERHERRRRRQRDGGRERLERGRERHGDEHYGVRDGEHRVGIHRRDGLDADPRRERNAGAGYDRQHDRQQHDYQFDRNDGRRSGDTGAVGDVGSVDPGSDHQHARSDDDRNRRRRWNQSERRDRDCQHAHERGGARALPPRTKRRASRRYLRARAARRRERRAARPIRGRPPPACRASAMSRKSPTSTNPNASHRTSTANMPITLNVQKGTGASEVTSSENVIAALPAIEAQYPDVAFNVLNVQADDTKAQLYGVLQTLIEGIVFTGIAMLLFLRSWRNALVVMIAIPASLLVTFFVMKLANFTIDTVSLLAMTLIIGILVDDSIVVLENVERHYEDGEAPRTAAILGRSEIGEAAVVITLVDVVVFLPIAFLPGQTGRFLGEFGVVVTIATLTSLFISFTVTPALAGNWSLLSSWRPPRFILGFAENFARLRNFYSERVLMRAFRHPKTVVAVSALLTAGAIALIPLGLIGFEFIPSVDRGQIFVSDSVPDRHAAGHDRRLGARADRRLSAGRRRADHHLDVGHVASRFRRQHQPRLQRSAARSPRSRPQAVDRHGRAHHDRHRAARRPQRQSRRRFRRPERAAATRSRSTSRSAPRAASPTRTRQKVLQVLEDTPGTANVNSSALNLAPQIDIAFNRDRARALNLNIGAAALAVKAAFGGALATQFDSDNGTKYVQVLYPMADQTSLATLRSITLRTQTGAMVHLGDVAVLEERSRRKRSSRATTAQTVIHISSNVAPGAALSNVQEAFRQRLAAAHLPNTVIVGTGAGGTQQNLTQTDQRLERFAAAFVRAGVLADDRALRRVSRTVRHHVRDPGGGDRRVRRRSRATRQSLNLFSLIGVVMLVGLVSKNGILLVDFAQLKVLGGR